MSKICSKCKTDKPLSEFSPRKDRSCGLRSQCHECDRKYVKANHSKISVYQAQYRQSERGFLVTKTRVAKYQRSERGKESLRRYVTSPKGRLARIRRRELEMAIDTLLSPQDIETIYRIFDSQCFNCRSMNNLHIDHHRPLSKGFGLSIQNATLLCGSCNSSKGDKSPEEFYTADQLKQLALILGEQYGNRQK